jgi:Glycosyl hydrolases family 32 N-terminal domain
MWECPDFFPVSLSCKDGLDPSVNTGKIKHVLKVGLMKTLQDYYLLGMYDEKTDTFIPDEGYEDDYRTWPMIDYGHVYASKSFFDAKKNRRIVWSWVNESDSEADDVERGWSGIQVGVLMKLGTCIIIKFGKLSPPPTLFWLFLVFLRFQLVILFARHSQGPSGWILMENN